ncbi:MAG: 23S rRNA (adenine(2503)-C(2))-methyltransferase RlmN, partial [Paludibacteraceae bacterium]|nr:23S rRNA (adenine(2503)-C(2))-methyltransferase RlmN [Paludibacteraceae bacterium]
RRLSFEYICWAGVNDDLRHAKQLLRLVSGLPCRVNLIRFHSTGDNPLFSASDEQRMIMFRDYLSARGVTCTIRRSRGEDILAACGMLVNALQK